MWGRFAVVGEELRDRLVQAGFEVFETKQGKYCKVYYFNDTEELLEAVEEYLTEKERER